MQNFYAKVHCPHACRYLIRSDTPEDDLLDIHPGYSEIGTIENKELRQHILVARDFDNTTTIERRYTIKLQMFSGEANL